LLKISTKKLNKFAQPGNLALFNSNGLSLTGLSFSTISAEYEGARVWLLELPIFFPFIIPIFDS